MAIIYIVRRTIEILERTSYDAYMVEAMNEPQGRLTLILLSPILGHQAVFGLLVAFAAL